MRVTIRAIAATHPDGPAILLQLDPADGDAPTA